MTNRLRPSRPRVLVAALVSLLLVFGVLAQPGAARGRHDRPPPPEVTTLLSGLSSPKGLDSLFNLPVVGQGAFGPPGPVLVHVPGFWSGGVTVEVSEPVALVDVAVARDLSLWGLGADQVLYRKTPGGAFQPVADIAAYQATDPDPVDLEGNPTETNPYGLAVLPHGDALVADAAGNDLLRVTPDGQVVTVARFGVEPVATDHLGDPTLPPELPTESVPTSIAVAHDGVYVGELKGFPFRPGTSRIWKLDPDRVDQTCSVDATLAAGRGPRHPHECVSVHDDLTAIQDLAYDGRGGRLYVYELAADGVLAFEAGFETGSFPPAVLLELDRRGERRELASGQLSQPGGVEVGFFGSLYATDGVFGDGRLVRIAR